MPILLRIVAGYLIFAAIIVAVHPIVNQWYAHLLQVEVSNVPWDIQNMIMAVAIVLTLVVAYLEKRRVDRDNSANFRRYIETNAAFYGAAALAIVFFWNWSGTLSPAHSESPGAWIVINTLLPLVLAAVAFRLCDKAKAPATPPRGVAGWSPTRPPLPGNRE